MIESWRGWLYAFRLAKFSDVALLSPKQPNVNDEASPSPDNGPIITPVKSAGVEVESEVQSDGSSEGSVNRTSKSAGSSEENLEDCQPSEPEKSESPTVIGCIDS